MWELIGLTIICFLVASIFHGINVCMAIDVNNVGLQNEYDKRPFKM